MPPTEAQIARYLTKRVLPTIREHGWMVQAVFGDGEHDPPFAYTVGLTEAGLPELVLTAAPDDASAMILNAAAERMCATDGDGFTVGDEVDLGFTAALQIGAVSVAAVDEMLGVAVALYGDGVRALQVIWPSASGKWPNDPDWDHPHPQPVLAEGPA